MARHSVNFGNERSVVGDFKKRTIVVAGQSEFTPWSPNQRKADIPTLGCITRRGVARWNQVVDIGAKTNLVLKRRVEC